MSVARSVILWLGIFKMSRRQLQQRWLESILISLGIALGVGVLTTGQTLVAYETRTLTELATEVMPDWRAVTVRPMRMDVSQRFFGQDAVPAVPVSLEMVQEQARLTLEDLLAVRAEVPGVGLATVQRDYRTSDIVAVDDGPVPGPRQLKFEAELVTPDEFAFRRSQFVAGGPFTWDDLLAGRPVVVLYQSGAERLFPDLPVSEVVGHTLTESTGSTGARWQIVGVVAPREGLVGRLTANMNPDAVEALVPVTAQTWLTGEGGQQVDPRQQPLDTLYFTPEDERLTSQVVAAVEAYFTQKHGAGLLEVRNPEAAREETLGWMRASMTALLVLAGLGLLIAAINILNLFTARVLRRQRLIGTSMALGATRQMLFWQMAGEAMLIGVLGSGLGLALAAFLVAMLRTLLIAQMGGGEMMLELYGGFSLGLDDALLGLAVGVGMSLLFGLYPAIVGSRQDPVEALRVE